MNTELVPKKKKGLTWGRQAKRTKEKTVQHFGEQDQKPLKKTKKKGLLFSKVGNGRSAVITRKKRQRTASPKESIVEKGQSE